MSDKNVLIIGTGTIGLPLIGLLARHKERFGIDNVFFNKNTPLKHDAAQIKQVINLGAKLVTDEDKFDGFIQLGLKPECIKEDAIGRATVVIDCTPSGVGLQNKREYYDKYKDHVKGFIAQGSENGFGKKFGYSLVPFSNDQFIQVVSCNTHSIAAIIKSLEQSVSSVTPGGIFSGDFVCLRRANDISQDGGFVPSTYVGKHGDGKFGTHHAADAYELLKEQFPHINLFSSAVKLNTQYMHAIRFSVYVDHIGRQDRGTVDGVIKRFENNPHVALTDKMSTNRVFSFGRDHGLYGRILSQAVVFRQTISVRPAHNGHIITGLCATPQDGNSILSSIAATLHFLDPNTVKERLSCYSPYIFQEI